MNTYVLIVLSTATLLSSCKEVSTDRCERNVRFDSCLSISATARPNGSESEWDDVVERCNMVAEQQSVKPTCLIQKECL